MLFWWKEYFMKILVTGVAGFIGSAVAAYLLERGDEVIGVDNYNDYYEPSLKHARIKNIVDNARFTSLHVDIADRDAIYEVFSQHKPDRVVHMAAQAGVRYSIENPLAYIDSNIVGFAHILEGCRHGAVKHLVYASSSSVYGANRAMPFSVDQNVDHPLSMYAASKKSNELMAHSYSHLYDLPTSGLRFFTVYGPWGRPDMALFKFTKAILENEPIKIFNYGKHKRDFTYIDDIVEGVIRVLDHVAKPNLEWSGETPDPASSLAPWRIYNIGNSSPVELMEYVDALEKALGCEAKKELLPMQPGDMPDTYADVEELVKQISYKPTTEVTAGVQKFVDWYRGYYKV